MKLKSTLTALATIFAAAFSAPAAEPLCWERTPNRPAPAQFDVFHGESLDFRCTFTSFGALPFSGSDAPRLYFQTNGMGAAWWSIPATVSIITNSQLSGTGHQAPGTNYQLSATFTPDLDPGADRLAVFFGAPSNAYAAAQVRFRNSPGPHPNDLEPPSVLDWQAELSAATNALAESLSSLVSLSSQTATNYTDQLRSDLETGMLRVAGASNALSADNASSAGTADYATSADSADNASHALQTEEIYDPERGGYHDGSYYASKSELDSAAAAGTNYTDAAYVAATSAVPGIVTALGGWEVFPGSFTTSNQELIENAGTNTFSVYVSGPYDEDNVPVDISGNPPAFWWLDSSPYAPICIKFPYNETEHVFDTDFGTFTARRCNALGLARPSDIPSTNGLISAATATNIAEAAAAEATNAVPFVVTNTVRAVAFALNDYIWDGDVCWRRQMLQGGYLECVAVTNIDVTRPENYKALEALERARRNQE